MNKGLGNIIFKVLFAALLLTSNAAMAQRESGNEGGSNTSVIHVTVGDSIFGGGNKANVKGSCSVSITQPGCRVNGDVYGGGALAHVNVTATGSGENITYSPTSGATTTVEITHGTIGGDVYGGGLGNADTAALVFGEVTVNIGKLTGSLDGNGFAPSESVFGEATLNGSVYGCNNVNGTPRDNVTVNIYKTAHTTANLVSGSDFAIANVFGGGNHAHYVPLTSGKKPTVHIWTCDNTIEYLYGGGNAADLGEQGTSGASDIISASNVIIDGGRIEWVFGGGNGFSATNNHSNPNQPNYNPGANIVGDASVTYHAGYITYLFGGSNEWGNITGTKNVSILNDGVCVEENHHIVELYAGNNKAPINDGGANFTMPCPTANDPCLIEYIFGGSREADITGNVELNIYGGLYNYVFAGNNRGGNITGNVTLNLYGGTINEAAFGGNNLGGTIAGKITVNMLQQGDCGLAVHNIYGGGNLAAYSPTTPGTYPEVNLIHGTVSKKEDGTAGNVYGGGLGTSATVTSNPVVNVGYDASMATLVSGLLPTGTSLAEAIVNVEGNVYGGGNLAPVSGYTSVTMQEATSTSDFTASTTVGGDIYGGGNEANVSASTTVNVTGGTVTHDVYGGGAFANVGTDGNDNTTVTLSGGTVNDIYGGGLGDASHPAAVNGPVQVTVNGGTVRDVFGCNNVNGAPQSTVRVDINNNVTRNVYGGGNLANCGVSPIVYINNGTVGGSVFGGGLGASAIVAGSPSVTIGTANSSDGYQAIVSGDVYGGGDMANVRGETTVLVQKCNTIINGDVYGGGNAAHILRTETNTLGTTSVTVTGGTINNYNQGHGMVFGGGHGDKDASPAVAANVAVSTNVTINGGTIYQVYGGSNSLGSINSGNSGGINVLVDKANDACDLHITELYGGGNYAASQAGNIDIRCTGTVENANEGINYVYGGANRANVTGPIELTINEGRIDYVFGGNNNSGDITGNITVNINKKTNPDPCVWEVGDVFGGGNHAPYANAPLVNIINGTVSGSVFGGGNEAGVGGSHVDMTGGAILGGLYGGCNTSGNVGGDILVEVKAGEIGSHDKLFAAVPDTTNVFGGGYGPLTTTTGNVVVTIGNTTTGPTIYGDVYGGSALGNVNTNGGTNTTTVNIINGTLVSNPEQRDIYNANNQVIDHYYVYHGGNVYGGGLGRKETVVNNQTLPAIAAMVYGKVTVNIGSGTVATTNPGTTLPTNIQGDATIGGNVYGCNNANGSPQDDVVVNVFQTAHTDGTGGTVNNTVGGTEYAIANVFGGGNQADFRVTGKTASVNIYTCYNTVRRVFGGGNAAATNSVATLIQGGRFHQVFGGGNGERGAAYAANVYGDVDLVLHGGYVDEFYGGSNQHGAISEGINVAVDNNGPCEGNLLVDEFFCGGNFVDITGDLVTTIGCSQGMNINNFYGGCNQANVKGNVILNLYGGNYTNVFGGSKGVVGGIAANIEDNPNTPNVTEGNVTLNLFGGTIENVYGGSNYNGNITGRVIVNVLDVEDPICPLIITNIYGGSNETNYQPTDPTLISPVVNVMHAKYNISGNVYGGSRGVVGTEVTVKANPLLNIGYVNSMSTYVSDILSHLPVGAVIPAVPVDPQVVISGSVFGGGDMAKVEGNTEIRLQNRSKVYGNVYGGGNMGEVIDNTATTTVVEGNTKVIVNGKVVE